MQIIEIIVQNNFTKEQLEEFLSNNVTGAKEDHKKQFAQFWKNEQAKIIAALSEPLRNENSGIGEIDWEI